jgi:hypothetical protein
MAFIDAAYFDAAVGAGLRTQMHSLTGGTYSATYFTARETAARVIVRAAWHKAGYSLSATGTALAQEATLGRMLAMGYARIKQNVPDHYADTLNIAELVRSGKIHDPDAAPDTGKARGGFEFSGQEDRDADNRGPTFLVDDLGDFG